MARRLQRRLADRRPGTPADTRLVRAPAEQLPFDDESFDTVVSTLVLCTVDDQPQALRELRRVLRPGGRLLFMEHIRADDGERLARWQDRMRPIGVRMAHGCRCNRRTVDGIRNAGFEVLESPARRDEACPAARPGPWWWAQRAHATGLGAARRERRETSRRSRPPETPRATRSDRLDSDR